MYIHVYFREYNIKNQYTKVTKFFK